MKMVVVILRASVVARPFQRTPLPPLA